MIGGQCCCFCDQCCGGTSPDEIDVILAFQPSGDSESCERCSDFFSGVFTLVRAGGLGTACGWGYHGYSAFNADINYGDCDDLGDPSAYMDAEHFVAKELELRFTIRCIDATHYRLELYVIQKFLLRPTYPATEPYPPTHCDQGTQPVWIENWYQFYDDVSSASWDCTRDGQVLTYRGMECICHSWPEMNFGGFCSPEFKPCTDTGALTASFDPFGG